MNDDNAEKINSILAIAHARNSASLEQSSSYEKKPRISPEERAAKQQEILRSREERKKMRLDGLKSQKKTIVLSDFSQNIFSQIVEKCENEQISALIRNLQAYNRGTSIKSPSARVPTGTKVKITGGLPKYQGMVGIVTDSRRVRCFVQVEGFRKPVYLLIDDIEPVD